MITFVDTFGIERAFRSGYNFDFYPNTFVNSVSRVILGGVNGQNIEQTITGLKNIRNHLSYHLKILKVIRANIARIDSFKFDGVTFSWEEDSSTAMSIVSSSLHHHRKRFNQINSLIEDFENRKRLRRLAMSNVPSEALAFQVSEFLMEKF